MMMHRWIGRPPRALAARFFSQDTIYALSSAEGRAGVAVVRISGPMADACLAQMTTTPALPAPRLAAVRKIYHPHTKELLDSAMAIRFTGEDIVELHLHGSRPVVTGVLEALSTIPTCRPAEAGEFTERAFENHKMDLMQVEGLADLLNSETEAQRKQALHQISGSVGTVFEDWRSTLVRCMAHAEANIDFGDDEDDVTDAAYDAVVDKVRALDASIRRHLADGRRGEILRNGVQVAILGSPNAGKSSLLNVLAQRDAAIVSPIAGTTRDIVTVPLNLAGYPVTLNDTAGIRETNDVIEQEGVSRAHKCREDAHIKILVIDIHSSVDPQLLQLIDANTIVVLNKLDLATRTLPTFHVQAAAICPISCADGAGIDAFLKTLPARPVHVCHYRNGFAGVNDDVQGLLITRERHRTHLQDCVTHLEAFLSHPYQSELAAEDLRRAIQAIGRILGRIDVEDILDVLFRDFCIGK
ncbi:tRNA modification GTPase TrmE [Saprolegnia parasitica CBS 223.65]|uniref:tRNA modification GTPase TrmE n=1 Tax=Saprolegnia parasitica (strain CBS 223.65) TaxID=695850 RepID=A0A067CL02_SAPPC|nr:tRNA modification GTPase TrmE [Saprolegnia parasitica CBS 223.65]KDO27216.1 tRNA modification GTPase TrmE [Saprolegnia parasitica CBS 223.65]|eukprot:XP_012201994.1 tRNA modification GTPase TrmE [Saprolegnia parasitica CBS 223.65]